MMLALEAVEGLCSGPSFLMADPMGPLLDQDEEEALSPSSSLAGEVPGSSPYRTLLSPPSSPPSFLEAKAGSHVTSHVTSPAWLAGDLLHAYVGATHAQDYAGMDWMSEKIDFGDLDLESLIGSCSSGEPPASLEDFIAFLHSHLDLESFHVAPPEDDDGQSVVPAELVLKVEPCSPVQPPSPGFSQTDSESPLPEPPLKEVSVKTSSPPSSDCDSDSGIESSASSPRAKPYARPELSSGSSPKVKSSSGAPKVVEKKLKKMEQNKTAATRYRQKKRVEQVQLIVEREALETRNRELAERADAIGREIRYLTDLMEEVRKHHRGKMNAE